MMEYKNTQYDWKRIEQCLSDFSKRVVDVPRYIFFVYIAFLVNYLSRFAFLFFINKNLLVSILTSTYTGLALFIFANALTYLHHIGTHRSEEISKNPNVLLAIVAFSFFSQEETSLITFPFFLNAIYQVSMFVLVKKKVYEELVLFSVARVIDANKDFFLSNICSSEMIVIVILFFRFLTFRCTFFTFAIYFYFLRNEFYTNKRFKKHLIGSLAGLKNGLQSPRMSPVFYHLYMLVENFVKKNFSQETK